MDLHQAMMHIAELEAEIERLSTILSFGPYGQDGMDEPDQDPLVVAAEESMAAEEPEPDEKPEPDDDEEGDAVLFADMPPIPGPPPASVPMGEPVLEGDEA